jgi:hypothetical protein
MRQFLETKVTFAHVLGFYIGWLLADWMGFR